MLNMMPEGIIYKGMLINRLKRIEGQVRGLQKMVDSGCDCESVLTQLAALRSAIESAGALVLNNYLKLCFAKSEEREPADIDFLLVKRLNLTLVIACFTLLLAIGISFLNTWASYAVLILLLVYGVVSQRIKRMFCRSDS